jgi:hypothetical protein
MKPRRCSKRWLDGDCPDGVLCIFDFKQPGERYDVIYTEVYGEGEDARMWGRGMSASPFHPQGIGMSFELKPYEVAVYRYKNKHRYAKWSTLPEDVKRCVLQDLAPEQEEAA